MKRIYLYPITKFTFRIGGNNYIKNLIETLNQNFRIINKPSPFGLFDLLFQLPKTDIIYLNWIEDIAGRRYATLQTALLFLNVLLAKLFRIKVVWFVHNNLSHFNNNIWLKKRITSFLIKHADIILSHSREVSFTIPVNKFYTFDHPVELFNSIKAETTYKFDLLIWGTVQPHKGVEEFLKFNYSSEQLQKYNVMIAGKFQSESYYNYLKKFWVPNVAFDNRILAEDELTDYFRSCRYVLFTYNSQSVLSSGALCKSLSFGKAIIGPDIGSFKELGLKKIIHTYNSFSDLKMLLEKLDNNQIMIDELRLQKYAEDYSWAKFKEFLNDILNEETEFSLERVAQ